MLIDNGNNVIQCSVFTGAALLHGRKARQSTSEHFAKKTLMENTTSEFRYSAGRSAPRLEGTQKAAGEERMANFNMVDAYDASGSKPQGRSEADVARPKEKIRSCRDVIKIGTWNVRTMNQGKLDIVKAAMKRVKMDLLRISELKWTQSGYFQFNERWVYYAGNETQKKWRGVYP